MKVILASAEKRCARIVGGVGIQYEAVNPNMDETLVTGKRLPPAEVAKALASEKAVTVARYYPGNMVLGASTIVSIDGELLGHPKSAADAKAMLRKLSGRTHEVHTGVRLVSDYIDITFSVRTLVEMAALTDEEIDTYLASGNDYLTCPGAYSLDGAGSILVDRINGDYNNCLGMPINELRKKLREHGMRV